MFALVFDAAGEETVGATGDIDPGVLLGTVGLWPHDADKTMVWVRLVARWARQRGLRVGFAIDEPTSDRQELRAMCD